MLMLFNLGLALLFFLPIIESFNRTISFNLLLFGSLFSAIPLFLKKKIVFDFLDALFLMLLVMFAFSTINSWSLSRSYVELTRYLAYFLIFIGIRNYEKKEDLIRKFYIPMIFANSFILSLLSLLYFIPGINLPIPTSGMNLFYPVFGHNRIVDLLIFTIPLSIFTISNLDDKRKRVLASFLSIFFIVVFILSMGRAALLSLTFSFFLYFFLQKDKFHKALTPWVTLLGIMAIFILSSIFIYSNFVIKEEEKVWQPLRRLYRPIESDFRIDYTLQAIKGFSLSPIFGTGLDTFRLISEKYQGKETFSYSWYTHNHYLQMFTETGIFGGLLFMVFIIVVLITAYRNIKNLHLENGLKTPPRWPNGLLGGGGILEACRETDRVTQAIFISLLASSIQSLIDFNWHFFSVFLLFWIGVGVAAILPKKIRHLYFVPRLGLYIFTILVIVLFSVQIFGPHIVY